MAKLGHGRVAVTYMSWRLVMLTFLLAGGIVVWGCFCDQICRRTVHFSRSEFVVLQAQFR